MGKQKVNCSIFTPNDIVAKMLDLIGYNEDLFGKKILENSCGDGNFLVEVVNRYIIDCKKQGLSDIEIKDGLEKDIVGFEIDSIQAQKCIKRLNRVIQVHGIFDVKWNIRNEDALKIDCTADYLYVVGNPPYITYSALSDSNRKYIKNNYSVCSEGKPDYYYAFIESAIAHLSEHGKLAYLVPSNFFKTKFSEKLRTFLLPFLTDVYDYQTEKLFTDVLTSSAIICCHKDALASEVYYCNVKNKKHASISKNTLNSKWIFDIDKPTLDITQFRFGDYFSASSSIATLCNEVYIINEKNSNSLCDIEKDAIKEAVSPKSLSRKKKEHIIFPYYYDEHNCLKHYSEDEYIRRFPHAARHLEENREKLNKRVSDESAKWFEYGRSQALAHLNQPKLLMSTLITGKTKVYELASDVIPYSGIYIVSNTPANNDKPIGLPSAKLILESEEFLAYAKKVGIYANGTSIRIAISDINNFTFSGELLKRAILEEDMHGQN